MIKSSENIQPLSSTGLQVFLHFDKYFGIFYFLGEIFLFFYKAYGLFYPSATIGLEVFGLVLFSISYFIRVELGTMGNKTESSNPIMYFIGLILIDAFGYIYYMALQTYVLNIELFMGIIGSIVLFFEFMMGIIALASFKNFEKLS